MTEIGIKQALPLTRTRKRLHADATLADVALAAGVSTATVSRCFNTPHAVKPATRARVDAAIRKLGYELDATARTLALRRSFTVGAVIPTLANAIFAAGVEGLQRRLAAAGYTLLLASHEYDLEQEFAQIRTLLARSIDGIFLIGKDHSPNLFERVEKRSVPYVLGWTLSPNRPSVGFDNRVAAAAVADYLWSIGHRRIAMIAGLTHHNDRARERLDGVRSALAERGARLDPGHVLERPYGMDQGREAMRALMSLNPRPTAVICGNDVLAFGALFEAEALQLNVPEDVSVTGFDDLPLAAQLRPGLTTVGVPAELMGARAAEYLLRCIDREPVPRYTDIPVELIVRGSTGSPRQ